MGKKERRRRRQRRSRLSAGRPTSIHDLPDDLLELVLLHAHSFVCLVRAAAACKPWRRVIAGGDFLRRFGRLHPPHVLGHYYDRPKLFFVPSPTPPGEAAINVRRHVSLDLLDHHCYGSILELCDGGSLLALVRSYSSVVVCDPWTAEERRDLRPPSPWEANPDRYSSYTFGAFFLLAGDDDADTGVDLSCFRMLCASLVIDHVTGTKTARSTMFSARHGGCWTSLGSRDVSAIIPGSSPKCWISYARTKFLGRAGGSLCWSGEAVSNAILHLDESSGTFSTFTLPADARRNNWSPYYSRENLRVVGGGGGGTVRLARVLGDDLEVLRWSSDGGDECIVERKACLSQLAGIELIIKINGWSWRFLDTAETLNPGHVVLLPYEERMWMFDVNVETMVLMRSQKSENWRAGRVFPYELPWPPAIKVSV